MKGLHHVGITVAALETAIDFYHGVLGLEFVNEPSPLFDDPELGPAVGVPGAALRQVSLALGDTILELLQYTAPPSPLDAPLPQNALGAQHVAFRVADAAATKAELEAKGVRFLSDVNVVDEGVLAGWRWVYFSDPEGNALELVQVAYTRPEERRAAIAAYLEQRAEPERLHMRYGVIFSCQDPEGSPIGHPAVYESALACAVAAEEQGYQWINVTEHHVAADGYLPALFVLLSAMAARTERIRLSTGMLILTLHSPLRIAEEAAVLDIISGGRLTLGVAAGYREVEFEAMQVDYRTRGKRFVESLELLRLAWTGEPFTFTGEIFQLPEVVVRPKPIQRPGIPLWLGGTTEVAMRRVVRHGAPVFPGATDEIGVVAKRMASYDRLREELGPPADPDRSAPRELVLPRLAVVADTTEEARRRAIPGIRAMLETYQSWGLPVDFTEMLRDWDLLDDLVIVGDADHCRGCVDRYSQLGLTDLMLQFATPAVDPGIIAESQARLIAEVATPAAEVHV